MDLGALGRVLGGGSGGGVSLCELRVLGAVDRLLKDRLRLVELELGLEVLEVVGIAGRVGSTASVGEVELVVKNLITRVAPTKKISRCLYKTTIRCQVLCDSVRHSEVSRHVRRPYGK